MKTIPVSLLVVGMVLPTLCLGQMPDPERREKGDGKGGKREGRRSVVEAWKLADSDGSGQISKTEFDALPRLQNLEEEKRAKLFIRLDKNSDGELQRGELAEIMKPFDGEMGGAPHLFELDSDKSGGVSFDEFKLSRFFGKLSEEKQKALFIRMDTDGDAQITPKDRPEPRFRKPDRPRNPDAPEKPEKPERFNRELDLNGDGTLSFEEFRQGPAVKDLTEDEQEGRFELLDRNKDLKISPEDFPPREEEGMAPASGI